MRKFYFLAIILTSLTLNIAAQSGRVGPTQQVPVSAEVSLLNERTAWELFSEVDAYDKKKFAEFEAKKIPFNNELYQKTLLEKRQMAAKYAAILSEREGQTGTDLYYLGMLHWIAINAESAERAFEKFLAEPEPDAEKAQTARSNLVIIAAQKKNFDKAEKFLGQYLQGEPVRTKERARMEDELARNYRAAKMPESAAQHAREAYLGIKTVFPEIKSRIDAINNLLNAGMLVFEIYSEMDRPKQAEAALEDLRREAAEYQSTSLYYYALNEHIKYLIEIGRKPEALEMYSKFLSQSVREFKTKPLQEDILRRLKKREKHYKLLGETAPELVNIGNFVEGQPGIISTMRGKVILLDFWATWCGPCIDAFPALIEWHETFEKDGLEILGITRYYGRIGSVPADQASEMQSLQEFKKEYRLPYDFVVADNDANQRTYGALSLPTTVLIDRKGIVRYVETGTSQSRENEIRQEIIKLLAEK
ncbi:MAG: TlpA disulfide reductase family protein [Pyrinomonadaceae bacterium]